MIKQRKTRIIYHYYSAATNPIYNSTQIKFNLVVVSVAPL